MVSVGLRQIRMVTMAMAVAPMVPTVIMPMGVRVRVAWLVAHDLCRKKSCEEDSASLRVDLVRYSGLNLKMKTRRVISFGDDFGGTTVAVS